jgi:hypothetical protein
MKKPAPVHNAGRMNNDAAPDSRIDFSKEEWNQAIPFFSGCWVIASKHNPGLNRAMELNNRNFVFRLKARDGTETLLVLGFGGPPCIEAVKRLERESGLSVRWIIGNGGAHHLFLELWYEAFPAARVLVPAKRIPFTSNGQRLQAKFASRWELMHGPRPQQLIAEFGDQIDVVIFDQLFSYKDSTSVAAGTAEDHRSAPNNVDGFKFMKVMGSMMKDVEQPTDEVFLFHRASGLAIAGHNFQLMYTPKGHKATPSFKLRMGGFPLSLMFAMMMPKGTFKSSLEDQPGPVADSKVHAASWAAVLDWDIRAWTSAHDPPTVCGPKLPGAEIKRLVRESIHRSGEDDPSGARLKWNLKKRKRGAESRGSEARP